MKKYILSFSVLATLVACGTMKNGSSGDQTDVAQTSDGSSISLEYMDRSVRPQDDFFQFANGSWVKNNPVPPSESRWGSFNELEQSNMKKLTGILEHAKDFGTEKDGTKRIGQYYASFMNMNLRNELGIAPIQDYLVKVEGVKSKQNLSSLVAILHETGINAVFRFGVSQDIKDVEKHIVSFGQGGLTLPNRDYYLENENKEVLEAYKVYIVDLLKMSGKDAETAQNMSKSIVSFETRLAEKMLRPAELRDPENQYHKYSRAEANGLLEGFGFETYLSSMRVAKFDTMNVGQPEYASFISSMVEDASLEDWKSYLYWRVLDHYAPHLDQKFVDRAFKFYGGTLSGKTEMKPMNEQAIQEITHMEFGELLGKAFVTEYYSPEAQKSINELVDNLLAVFQERIQNLEWMTEDTKRRALMKLNSIGRKLGYPDKWTDFSALNFNPEDYIGNFNRSNEHSVKENLAKLHKPVNKHEWGMPAHMVNAYYHPLLNEIAFPAGIMQPPFFSPDYEDAVNYGRIGMVIGHEFTHGFDDNGSRFDADGNFNNWWKEEDRSLFEERTGILGNTFEQFCPIDGHCVNPQLTMGENIADLGGLTLAYHAYTRTEEFKSGEEKYGFTPAQRFFIAYAQLWKINFTDAELKKRIATDPHSPGMYRVNGPLKNCPEFFEAFNVKEGDAMRNKEEKVARIW